MKGSYVLEIDDLIGKNPPPQNIVDEAYKLFNEALQLGRIKKIHRVRNLYFPGPGNKTFLYGMLANDVIYLDATSDKQTLISTLIHELVHFVFSLTDRKRDERKTLKAERRLFRAFSKDQKEMLWYFIPKIITLDNVDKEKI